MVLCTEIVTNNNEKIFAWATNNPNYSNRYIESKITEIHFSNGLVFKFNFNSCLSCLSAELSLFLLKHKFSPFGSRYIGSAIVELRSFPCNGYKLLDYLDFVSVKQFEDREREMDRTSYPVVKKNPSNYGVVPEDVFTIRQFNSLCDIILMGEFIPSEFDFLYTRKDDVIFIKYKDYKRKNVYYTYKYKITDLKKFLALITKIHIQFDEYFNVYD